jgi:hypothetical protein
MALLRRSDIKRKPRLKPGFYAFRVIRAESKISQSGNDMFKLVLEDVEGQGTITTFIVLIPKCAYQLLDFCEAANLQLPDDEEAQLVLERSHFENRFVYGQVIEEDETDRTSLKRILTREDALKKAPRLAMVSVPENAPCVIPIVRPGSLPPPIRPAKPKLQDPDLDKTADDLPFRTRIYREVKQWRGRPRNLL